MQTLLDKQWWKVAVDRQFCAVLITKHSWLKDIRRTETGLGEPLFALHDWQVSQKQIYVAQRMYLNTYSRAKYFVCTILLQ